MTDRNTALRALEKAAHDDYASFDWPGCQGGDKWPATESVWRCPVCDAEFYDTDHEGDGE